MQKSKKTKNYSILKVLTVLSAFFFTGKQNWEMLSETGYLRRAPTEYMKIRLAKREMSVGMCLPQQAQPPVKTLLTSQTRSYEPATRAFF